MSTPVYPAPHLETDADTSRDFLSSVAGEDATQHWHMRSQMDFTFLFLKYLGYNLYYTREKSIPTCFREGSH